MIGFLRKTRHMLGRTGPTLRRHRPQRRQSTVLLQRRTDFSVPVHMHSFLDHGGLRDPRRPLAGLTFAAHFL